MPATDSEEVCPKRQKRQKIPSRKRIDTGACLIDAHCKGLVGVIVGQREPRRRNTCAGGQGRERDLRDETDAQTSSQALPIDASPKQLPAAARSAHFFTLCRACHHPRDFPGKLRTSDADCGSAAAVARLAASPFDAGP